MEQLVCVDGKLVLLVCLLALKAVVLKLQGKEEG